MDVIRYGLPVLLLAYFLLRGIRQHIFLLGIPYLKYMGSAVFFDWVRLPKLDSNQFILLSLLGTWVICTGMLQQADAFSGSDDIGPLGKRHFTLEEIPWILIAAITIVNITLSVLQRGDFARTSSGAFFIAYLIVGYFLVRGIVAHSSRQDVIEFLEAIVIVNTLTAVLYFLHQGLQLPIYQGQEHTRIMYQGQVISRTFWFMPSLFAFSLSWHFAKPQKSLSSLVIIAVNLLGILISYTRFLLLTAAMLFFLSIGLRLVKTRARARLWQLVVPGLLMLVLFLGMSHFLPAQAQYLLDRVAPLTTSFYDPGSNSLFGRQDLLRRTWDMTKDADVLLGQGFSTAIQNRQVLLINQWRADSVWIPIMFRLGLLGVAFFASLLLLFLFRALRWFFQQEGEDEYLGLVFVLLLAAVIIEGFVSSSFLYWIRYPLGLWYLAVISVEANRVSSDGKEVRALNSF